MEKQERNFFSVLESALWNKPLNLTEPIDYVKILDLAYKQQLSALVFEKLCEDTTFKNSEIYVKMSSNVVMTVIGQSIITRNFLTLYKELNDNNFFPLVVKGIICRKLYGKYEDHRPSSDEDLLVKKSDFKKISEFLIEKGYTAPANIDYDNLDNIQAVTFVSPDKSINIELHANLVGNTNELYRNVNSYFQDVFENYIQMDIDGVKVCTFNHTKHFLFLILHAFKHFTSSGFGVRQLIDILLYQNKFNDEIDWAYVERALTDIKANKFFADLVAIGNKFLGFNLEYNTQECCPEDLLDDLLQNGIFGNDTNAKVMAGTMTYMAVDSSNSKESSSKIKSIIKSIFPNKASLIKNYPELKNNNLKLPVIWVQRWIRFIKRNKKNGGNLAQESIDIGNRRIALLKKYGIVK